MANLLPGIRESPQPLAKGRPNSPREPLAIDVAGGFFRGGLHHLTHQFHAGFLPGTAGNFLHHLGNQRLHLGVAELRRLIPGKDLRLKEFLICELLAPRPGIHLSGFLTLFHLPGNDLQNLLIG